MANEATNIEIIECQPYGDSETEIVNLKPPSYEIISMPNIFDYESTVRDFVTAMMVIAGLGVMALIGMFINKLDVQEITDSRFYIGQKILYLFYIALCLVGLFVSLPQATSVDLFPWYIVFGVAMLFIGILRMGLASITNSDNSVNILPYVALNTLLPGTKVEPEYYKVNVFVFFVLWIIFYIIISVSKLIASQDGNSTKAFSPDGLLASYCFVHILNFLKTNLGPHNDSNKHKGNIPPAISNEKTTSHQNNAFI